ncbi:MAG: hypothetical protein DCC65_06835 [Planctomycetota bacterium]|nr:MAG: hypothetical protein DCC65_06835 [Planctomycetota bacterium]
MRQGGGMRFLPCAFLLFAIVPARWEAPCVPFADGLESAASIAAAGGFVSGSAAFSPAVSGSGVTLSGSGFITYSNSIFNAASGSVAMWVRKNAADAGGGLFQIGIVGQPHSVGLVYGNDDDLYLEARGAGGVSAAVLAESALSLSEWRHVVATWRDSGVGVDLWLFVGGRYSGFTRLTAPWALNAGQMQVGFTGFYGLANVRIDELRYCDWRMSDDEVYAEFVVSAGRYSAQPVAKPPSTGTVRVSGRSLLVDGAPYTVKGVGYQPIPIGMSISGAAVDFVYTDGAILSRDMAILRAMGVNTIRTWSQPPDTTLLDACWNGGVDPIRVILGFWVPQEPGVNYAHPGTAAAIELAFREVVNRFKGHPALLAWGIGNENNFTYARPLAEWYALANDLAVAAYEEEGAAYHPCVIVNGGLQHLGDTASGSDDAAMTHIDIWGTNAYPGASFQCFFDYFETLSTRPIVITEYGIDAFDQEGGVEYESTHAEYVVAQWRELRARSIGGAVMAYSDEWWKAGDPSAHDLGGYGTAAHPDGYSNEEWWGLLRAVDSGPGPDELQPREAYFALAAEFLGLPGDLNCSGTVDLSDIEPFVVALVDAAAYGAGIGAGCDIGHADVNGDGRVDGQDIGPFVQMLTGAGD